MRVEPGEILGVVELTEVVDVFVWEMVDVVLLSVVTEVVVIDDDMVWVEDVIENDEKACASTP